MKRKLSLLLAMVLAMTMVMGIGVTAFASTIDLRDCAFSSRSAEYTGSVIPIASFEISITDSGGNEIPAGYYNIDVYEDEGCAIPADLINMGTYYVIVTPNSADCTGKLTGILKIGLPAGIPENVNRCTDYPEGNLYYIIENGNGGVYAAVYNLNGGIDICWDTDLDLVVYVLGCTPEYGKVYHKGSSEDVATLCPCNSTTPPDPAPTPAGPSSPAHTHNFQWQTITAPTKDADGLEGEVCSCGATRNTQKLSAYAYSLNEYATPMINAAKSGQTITFEFGEWNSFPKSFMETLVNKSAQGVTFVFHYKWNHVKQEITIPAGTPIDLNFDYYGPAKMAELYGAN